MNKKLFYFFRFAFGIGLILLLFKFIPYSQLIFLYRSAKKIYILYAFLFFFLGNLLAALRWRYLLFVLGIKVSLREAIYSSFSGYFFNIFFPSFVAGDLFRGISIFSRYGQRGKVISSVFIDRLSGIVGLSLLAFFFFLWASPDIPKGQRIFVPIFIINLGVGIIFLIIFSRRAFSFFLYLIGRFSVLREKLLALHEQLYIFSRQSKAFWVALIFSFFIQILIALSFFFSARAFGVDLNFIYFLIFVPLIMFVSLIPVTLIGMGTREAAAVYFFSLVGLEKGISLSLSLLHLAFSLVMVGLGGILYLAFYQKWLEPPK